MRGGAGGSARAPRRSTPWANLGGGGRPDQFLTGGRIDYAGIAIARIELRFANGVTLHANADQGVALFITEQTIAMPGTAALVDEAGNEAATHRPFPGP